MPLYAGKGGAVTVNTELKPLDTWSVDVKVDPIDITNFMSGGWTELLAGIFSAELSCSGPYNGDANVTQGTAAVFILQVAPGLTQTVTALVTSVKIDNAVKDAAKIAYTASSTGTQTITLP